MNGPSDWMAAQQQLWQQWQSFMSGGNSTPQFGTERFANFWRPFGFNAANAANPASLFSTMFAPWAAVGAQQNAPEDIGRWLQRLLEGLQSAAGGAAEHDPFSFMNSFLRSPLGAFGNFTQSPFASGDWLNMKPSEFAGLFDLPPLGPGREWETKWRELHSAAKEEFEASGALGRQLGQIYYRALKEFARILRDNDAADGDITNLRGLYDLWVDVAEAAYRDRAMTEDYAQAFGRTINANSRSRNAWQSLLNDYQEAMNLPNRREIDSLIARQAELVARVAELEAREPSFDADALAAKQAEFAARIDKLEAVTASFDTDDLIARQAEIAARVGELETTAPSFDIDELIARVDSIDGRIDALARRRAASDEAPETGKRTKRKPAARVAELPARRVGPAKRKAAQARKTAKSKSARVSVADEFDIGNLGSSS